MKNAAQLILLEKASAGTLLKTICFPSSFVTRASSTSNERT
jgi:hypothetical protein